MTSLGTYWRTLRHMRHEQVLGRVKLNLARSTPDLRPSPPLRDPTGTWVLPAMRPQSLIADGRFCFLNVEHALDPIGWDNPAIERLWRYNLHYFDDLNAVSADQRAEQHRVLVARWVAENPPGEGTGWEPFPTSLRIVNWVKWFIGGASPDPAWLHSLAIQARWLGSRLEWHLLGNHLFANAKAMIYAGLFFQGAEADSWLKRGLSIMHRELHEQILADGGHFERSPMYHALVLEDVLDLMDIVAARAPPHSPALRVAAVLREIAPRMMYWLRAMTHPDGTLGLFNDTADGIAPANSELERFANALTVGASPIVRHGVSRLDTSGYLRVERDSAVTLVDVAPIGPDYLPGHAHADTLSFELSVGARRVIVNGGTSCYGLSTRRLHERGTAAHSTVQVSGENSSEVWSGFRVGRRARPVGLAIDGWTVRCAHDGYCHLPGSPEHRRQWTFGTRELVITDTVSSGAPAVARYHVAPGLQFASTPHNEWLVGDGGPIVARVTIETGDAVVSKTLHAPRFGVLLPAQTLEVTLRDGRAVTRWSW